MNSLLPTKELRRPIPNVLLVVTRDFLKPLTGIEATSPKISTPPPEFAVFANTGQKLKLPKQNRRDEEEAAATPEESVRRNKLIQCGELGEETELSATNYYGFAHFVVAYQVVWSSAVASGILLLLCVVAVAAGQLPAAVRLEWQQKNFGIRNFEVRASVALHPPPWASCDISDWAQNNTVGISQQTALSPNLHIERTMPLFSLTLKPSKEVWDRGDPGRLLESKEPVLQIIPFVEVQLHVILGLFLHWFKNLDCPFCCSFTLFSMLKLSFGLLVAALCNHKLGFSLCQVLPGCFTNKCGVSDYTR
nr:hypothetical protein Iba_chr03aCG1840 [Ipomoea batatas]